MALIEVRRAIGGQTVLFGNIEASEIEPLDADAFEARVRQALDEGMAGQGRGFVRCLPRARTAGRSRRAFGPTMRPWCAWPKPGSDSERNYDEDLH